jgi:hypothetical protein
MEVAVFSRIARRPVLAGLSAFGLLAVSSPLAAQSAPAQSTGGTAPSPISRAQLSTQLDATFKELDSNSDKSVSIAEIDAAQQRAIAQSQAAIAKRVEAEFARLDSNKDGQVSLTEFRAGAPGPRVTPSANVLSQLDSNKDGKVTADEYRAPPLANFDRLDLNKDGTISVQEQAAAKQR